MKWISHRGESYDAPENTCEAFALSSVRNTDGMECDIHLTADKVLVTAHDCSTKRTSGVDLLIEETTFAELQKLDVAYNKESYRNVRIPRFADTLQYLEGNREYYVEIKMDDEEVIHAMVRELDAAGIDPDQVTMISFHANMVKRFKELYPERKSLFLTGFKASQDGTWTPTAEQLIAQLTELKADGVDIHCNTNFLTAEYVQKIHDAGFVFAVWTVDDPGLAKLFMDWNVDSITSNRAAFLRNKLD